MPHVSSACPWSQSLFFYCSIYYCYILRNTNPLYSNLTYNGITNNLSRRLRQHNGEIKGGAKSTKNKGIWYYLVIIECDLWESISDAMKFEYSVKYPTRKKPRPREFQGPNGRINSLPTIFNYYNDIKFRVYIKEDYYDNIINLNLSDNIEIIVLSNNI